MLTIRVSSSISARAGLPCSPATISMRRARGRRRRWRAVKPNMWRYRELMPLFDGEQPLTLGEGWTPLIHARRLGKEFGLERLFVKDESLNPTNSFKARGLSAAVTRAAHLGARVLSVPSAGNAANAMAAYAAAGGHRSARLHAARRQDSLHPRVRAVRRAGRARRRTDHRRRARRRRKRESRLAGTTSPP